MVHGTGTAPEATGLTKGRIGTTVREAAPVLAALGYTVPVNGLTVTSAQQLATIAGHSTHPSTTEQTE